MATRRDRGATRAGVGDLPVVMRPPDRVPVASPDNAEHHHNDNIEEDTTMTNTTKTLWGGYYYETDGQTYWKAGEVWDTERVEVSEAEYNEAMADRQDYYDHRDIYDNDEQLLWDIETEAAIEEETGHPMTSEVEDAAERMAIEALVEAWDAVVDSGDMSEIEMAESLTDQVEGGAQGWDMSVEDAEDHPEIAAMIGLDPEADPETDEEMERWEAAAEAWGRVVGEAARRWLASHPEAAQAAREEE